MAQARPTRRTIAFGGSMAGVGLLLAACDRVTEQPRFNNAVSGSEALTYRAQRLLVARGALAREFCPSEITTSFPVNGTRSPDDDRYRAMAAGGFADWRLVIDGMVAKPAAFSIAELKRLPFREQITRHDCVEGWSAIAKWRGAPLGLLLRSTGVKPGARYAVFHCADDLDGAPDGSGRYYESIDLADAFHPQTILAYAMNDAPLPIGHGAPLRLRVERQLGYKHAKYVMRVEVTDRLTGFGRGRGGYWEDRGYQWYAGI